MPTPSDPLPPIRPSGLGVSYEAIATLPASAATGPVARIQQISAIPGSSSLAVLDTRGIVWELTTDGIVGTDALIDLRGANGFLEPGPESGLRSIAFHPDFAREGSDGYGKVYLAYSAEAAAAGGTRLFGSSQSPLFHDVVAEYTADPDTLAIDPSSVRELFHVEQPYSNHNFGQLAFDTDLAVGAPGYGLLYLGLGDGGGGNDPLNAAEELGLVYGKILRIDPVVANGQPYTVPSDNPFVGVSGALPEIFAYGFRNPQQLSFHEGQLLASDIGQGVIEEINLVREGASHGWDDREGVLVNENGRVRFLENGEEAGADYQYPIIQYDHEEIGGSAAVGGGYVYEGTDLVGFAGSYVFTDFPSGRMFVLPGAQFDRATGDGSVSASEAYAPGEVLVVDANGDQTSFAQIAGNASGRVDLRLFQTADGELLAFSKQNGTIYRLTATEGARIDGTSADDWLAGTQGDDTIMGGAGDDVIYGDAAPEAIYDDGF